LKESASLVFSVSCTWLRFCTFPSVGWVKYEVLLIIIYVILTVMVYIYLKMTI
jgi:hypothetical protein